MSLLLNAFQPIIIAAGVNQETRFGQVLQLLPDFRADKIVVGMQGFQLPFVGINILVREFQFAMIQTGFKQKETKGTKASFIFF